MVLPGSISLSLKGKGGKTRLCSLLPWIPFRRYALLNLSLFLYNLEVDEQDAWGRAPPGRPVWMCLELLLERVSSSLKPKPWTLAEYRDSGKRPTG